MTPSASEHGPQNLGLAGLLAQRFIDSKLTPLFIGFAVLLGGFATLILPREEEPQIVVPMIDVFVSMPGASPREVAERVTKPMEKLLWEVDGVEYIYSTSSPGAAMAVVRFYVGQNEEDAIVRVNQKMFANFDLIPPGASQPLIKPRSIDDVPILALTLWSRRYGDFELRRLAAQMHDSIKRVDNISAVEIIGGHRREILVEPDSARLAAHNLTILELAQRLASSNSRAAAGEIDTENLRAVVETGAFLASGRDVEQVVVAAHNQRPVFVRDVARVYDGGEEPTQYVRFNSGGDPAYWPAVTLAVSKRKGSNAIEVAEQVLQKVENLKGGMIPADVEVAITRNYGDTAKEKSDELLFHMGIAVVAVSVLIWLTLGFRESWIVFIAIPVTLALTLAVFSLYGYTLNRITLFALIFSIGLLVDDAIVVVENIVRHSRMPGNRDRPKSQVAIEAVSEVGNPTILATLTVIAAVLPMAFVRGLMGPYMRPIPVGASAAMAFSLVVAFIVTPWAAIRVLRNDPGSAHSSQHSEDYLTRLYRRVMGPLLHRPVLRYGFLSTVVLLLLASMALVAVGFVKVKMLPFDNKSEFQIIVDMPEGTTLEETTRVARELADEARKEPEVVDLQLYAGVAAPYNFNGLVRHYFLRRKANLADIQVNLKPKHERAAQSHEIARRVRDRVAPLARAANATIQVAEVPPGPPVLQTVVAEVYGPSFEGRIAVARQIREIFETTGGIVDVDWYVEDDQPKYELAVDKGKAALHGVSGDHLTQLVRMATSGNPVGLLHAEDEKEDVSIRVRPERASRGDWNRVRQLRVRASDGSLVPLGELLEIKQTTEQKNIYHKNLMPVTYVTADLAGEIESPVYAVLETSPRIANIEVPEGYRIEQYSAVLPAGDTYAMKWDGEWHITYEVFRDLGLAFAVVLVLIYVLVVGWFESFVTPLVIMSAIPFSLVGILPAHGVLGAFFTATSMIGFIAGAGIVVRNSIILVDFIELRRRQGMPLDEAVVDAGAVRFRPMVLTAAAVVAGAGVILFDPIFQGLAISLMAGEVASLLLSRMTVPVVYFLAERKRAS
jgi:multidrug efflux pump subunit AcrB